MMKKYLLSSNMVRTYIEYEPSSGLIKYIADNYTDSIVVLSPRVKTEWKEWLNKFDYPLKLISHDDIEKIESSDSAIVFVDTKAPSDFVRSASTVECWFRTPCPDVKKFSKILKLNIFSLIDDAHNIETIK